MIHIPHKLPLIAILVAGIVLRLWFAFDIPFSGDEMGVGLLQAAGNAPSYEAEVRSGIFHNADLRAFVRFSPARNLGSVVQSLRSAGMHPPLYFFLLHSTLRFGAPNVIILRSLSILFSVLSIAFVYMIALRLVSRRAALLAALLLSISSYGVAAAGIVRPYPIAMFLSLALVWQTFRMRDSDTLNVRSIALFSCIALAGLFTTYQYIFVLTFSCALLAYGRLKQPNAIKTILISALCIVIGYVPWLPILISQLHTIQGGKFYFNSSVTAGQIVAAVGYLQFSMLYDPQIAVLWYGLVFAWLSAIMIGLVVLWKRESARPFVAAFAVYIVVYYLSERLFSLTTILNPKFMFFIMPVLMVAAAVGIDRFTGRKVWKKIFSFYGIAFLLLSTVLICMYKPNQLYISEAYILTLRTLSSQVGSTHPLVILNTRERRFVLPIAEVVPVDSDLLLVASSKDIDAELATVVWDQYPVVIIADVLAGAAWFPIVEPDSKVVEDMLRDKGYSLAKTERSPGRSREFIFRLYTKKPAS